MWDDASFWTALRNTVYYTVFHIPLTLAASLGLALLLNRKLRGVRVLPHRRLLPLHHLDRRDHRTCGTCCSARSTGRSTRSCGAVGVDNPPGWTTSADWSMPAVIIVGTWRDMGYYMLLFLAGLQTIPAQLYEAARDRRRERLAAVPARDPARAAATPPSSSPCCSPSAASRSST